MDGGVAGEVGGEPLDVAGLALVVELGTKRRRELVDETGEVVAAGRAGQAADRAHRGSEDLEVQFDLLDDTRSSDLDDDLGAVGERRGVHLPDRRGGHRLRIEHREDGLDGRTQFGGENIANDGCGFRGCGVLQLRQLDLIGGSEQVGSCRKDLADLDRGDVPMNWKR